MMKGLVIGTMMAIAAVGTKAQVNDATAMHIVQKNGVTNAIPLEQIEELTYNASGDSIVVNAVWRMAITEVSEIAFGSLSESVEVSYSNGSASVFNPYCLEGVSASVVGADVVLTNRNEEKELTTVLSGSSANGSFLYMGTYKSTIVLDGLNLTNTRGAAIDLECGKRMALNIKKGTVNTLADGKNGEQKAALYCKGHLEIDKAGTLNVTGNTAHAISAKEYIKLKKSDGVINILGAVKDGIHCKQFLLGNGFTVNISGVQGDGIDVELDGEENDEGYADGSLNILAGTYDIQSSADTAKGLKAEQDIVIKAGSVSVKMSGRAGKGIKADNNILIGDETDHSGPSLNVATSGSSLTTGSTTGNTGNTGGWGGGRPGGGGPGGNSNSNSSSSKALKAMNQVLVYGGAMTITTSTDGAEGLEGKKGVTIYGGNHYLKCYDDCINSGGKVDFAGGTTACWSNGNDAVDSNYGQRGAITVSGGNIFAYTTKGSPEEGLDCDNNSYIVVTGGIAISAGGSQGGGSSSSIGSSTQGYYLGSSPSSYNATYYYTLYSTDNTPICTYKFGSSCSNSLSLLTANGLGKGSVTVKYGTSRPTSYADSAGDVFFIAPTVVTNGTTATVTAK